MTWPRVLGSCFVAGLEGKGYDEIAIDIVEGGVAGVARRQV